MDYFCEIYNSKVEEQFASQVFEWLVYKRYKISFFSYHDNKVSFTVNEIPNLDILFYHFGLSKNSLIVNGKNIEAKDGWIITRP